MLRYFTMTFMGLDRIGREYRQQAIDTACRLDLETPHKSIAGRSRSEVEGGKRISKPLEGSS